MEAIVNLMERSFGDTADMLTHVDDAGWAGPSPCGEWTVRQVGNHLVGAITVLTKIADESPVEPVDIAPQALADTNHLGSDPAAAFNYAAKRCIAVFARPGVLDQRFALPAPDSPGVFLANICLLESLVHGWDIAHATGVGYQPDEAVIAAVKQWTAAVVTEELRGGRFGPAIPTGANADAFTATLGHLGRRA